MLDFIKEKVEGVTEFLIDKIGDAFDGLQATYENIKFYLIIDTALKIIIIVLLFVLIFKL